MEVEKLNHGIAEAEPWKLASPSIEVAESNHALPCVHGWTSAFPSIGKIFNYLT
jgi:hypothetical protein